MQKRVSRDMARATMDRFDAILARHAAHAYQVGRELVLEMDGVSVRKGRTFSGSAYVSLETATDVLFCQHEDGERYTDPRSHAAALRFKEAN